MKTIYLALILVFISGCVTAPEFAVKHTTPTQQNKGPNAQEAAQLKKANSALTAGDTRTALLLLDDIAKNKSESETYFDALTLMGKILEREGRQVEAQKAYLRIIESNYIYPRRSFAIYRMAQIAKSQGQIDTALKYIDLGLQTSGLALSDRVIFQKLKYPLLIEKEEYGKALNVVDFVVKNATKATDVADAKDIIRNLISIRLSRQQLLKITNDPELTDYHGLAYAELGKAYFYAGNVEQAELYFDKALSALSPQDPIIQQINDLKKFSSIYTNVDRNAIAVLVPLTGAKKPLGENILRGLQTALGKSSDMRLIIKDTEADPQKASELAKKAIFEDRVMGVIGGVTASAASSIVKVTSKFGVPFLILTPKSGLVENYDYTFQNALPLKIAARKSAEMVLKDGRYNRIAILKSADNFGELYGETFAQHLIDNGKEVEHIEAYNLTERGSLNNAIKALIQVNTIEGREDEYKKSLNEWKNNHPSARRLNPPSIEDLLPPIVDFDALFIADSAKNGALVAATLAYFDVEDIPLIGTHLWNSPELIRRAPQQVEGAMFIDSLPPDNAWPSNLCTRSLSQALNGREPNAFTVLGYDAARVFRTALKRRSSNRVQFKENLQTLTHIDGCLGNLTMEPTRIINRPVFGLKVENGAIVQTQLF